MSQAIAQLGLLDDEAIVLDEAALALAQLDHPDVDLDPYIERLGDMAAQLMARGAAAYSVHDRAALLAEIIADEQSLTGDSITYDDPANADLIAVMDRGRGLPVALSILYVSLARRVGWMADALNTPGHMLVRLGTEPTAVIQDPFDSGAILDMRRLNLLFARLIGPDATPEPEHLTALSNRSVLVRLLSNQAIRARRSGNIERALVLHERLTTIAPAFTGLWWEKARLEQLLGRVHDARGSLSAMIETTRDAALRTRARAALGMLARSTS